jgi:predicted ATP-grasp superfamily ATP-dependent carboligase
MSKRAEKELLPVVIGGGSYNDLGVIRSLGERGLQSVYLTDGEHIIPIKKSKYLIATIITKLESDIVSSLKQIAKEYEKQLVLFPTSDDAAVGIDKNYQTLSAFAVLPNTQGRMAHFMDKAVQASLAHQAGFNVPNSTSYDLESDNVPFDDIHLTCIVKPLLSIKGSKAHITVCRTKDELKSCINFYKDNSEFSILIQDFIEHKDQKEICITGVCLPNHEVIFGGIIEKYRTIGNGSTTYGKVHVDVDNQIASKVRELMKRIPYSGIFDIECFISPDKELTFIECNLRNGAYGYSVTRAGINLPWLFYAHAAGQSTEPSSTHDVVFMEERSDFLHVTRKEISPRKWIRDVWHTDVFLFSNRRDIGPMTRIPPFIKKHLPTNKKLHK